MNEGTIEQRSVLELRGSAWQRLRPDARATAVRHAFEFWRSHGFPYYRLGAAQLRQEMSTLVDKDTRSIFGKRDLRASNAGLRLANSFQPRMWSARVNRYLSPMQVFRDDQLLKKAIERSFRIWPDRFGANASCIRRILKSFPGAASVSNYRPTIAKAVISKYCPKRGTVVDFSAGYGGRLLGSIAARRDYIGIEPNRAQVNGFIKMSRAISTAGFVVPAVRFLNGPAEKELLGLEACFADLVFSSPPFFDWEHYSRSNDQSFRRYPRYDVWLAEFLSPVVLQSHRVLKRKGRLVLNVTNGNRLPTPEDVSHVARSAGFQPPSTVYEMVFPKLPYLHPRGKGPVKRELIMVFER